MDNQPSESQITMAREALERDAAKWRDGAEVMRTAAQEAASLGLTGFHFGHIASESGVVQRYAELQEFATRILSEGATSMADMEWALRTILDNYDRADQGASVRVERAGETG